MKPFLHENTFSSAHSFLCHTNLTHFDKKRFCRRICFETETQGNAEMVYLSGLLIFRAVAEPRISSKSAKFTKTREIPRNSLEILPNTCRHSIFESYLGCWGCLLAVNLLIYLETLSLQRVNNISKLLGVLKLMLRKTGKHPGVPSVDRGNWG